VGNVRSMVPPHVMGDGTGNARSGQPGLDCDGRVHGAALPGQVATGKTVTTTKVGVGGRAGVAAQAGEGGGPRPGLAPGAGATARRGRAVAGHDGPVLSDPVRTPRPA